MGRLRCIFSMLVLVCANVVFAQSGSVREISVKHGGKTYLFRCESADGVSAINVTLLDASGARPLLKHTLDEFDDCSYATWHTESVGRDRQRILVLINPGRLGVNAQFIAFQVIGGEVAFAGYLPVSAEKAGDSEYRSVSSETGSIWERTEKQIDWKFTAVRAMELVLAGKLCVSKAGEVLRQDPCESSEIVASFKRPICVKHQAHKGRLAPVADCDRLVKQLR